jgi:hypothetical protein
VQAWPTFNAYVPFNVLSCVPACRGKTGYAANSQVKGVGPGPQHIGRLGGAQPGGPLDLRVPQEMVKINKKQEEKFKKFLIDKMVATGVENIKVTRE